MYLSWTIESWLIKQIVSQSHLEAYHSFGHFPFFFNWYLSYFADFCNINLIGLFKSFRSHNHTIGYGHLSFSEKKETLTPLQLGEKDAFVEVVHDFLVWP